MKVILIYEDNHGQIGVALNYYHAVEWLINNDWISYCTEVWDDNRRVGMSLHEYLGEDWATKMMDEWNIDDFNEFWNFSFQLVSVTVIGTEEEEE